MMATSSRRVPISAASSLKRSTRIARGAFECGGRINHTLARFDIPASHLFRALVGPREKRLCQRLETRFACDLSLRPPFGPIGQIEILETCLAIRRLDRLLEHGVELSLLTDAFEDRGATLVQVAQISQPLLERTQLGVIERSGRLLPVAGNKGHGRSAVEQRDGGSDLLLADAQFLSDAQADRLHRSRAMIWMAVELCEQPVLTYRRERVKSDIRLDPPGVTAVAF